MVRGARGKRAAALLLHYRVCFTIITATKTTVASLPVSWGDAGDVVAGKPVSVYTKSVVLLSQSSAELQGFDSTIVRPKQVLAALVMMLVVLLLLYSALCSIIDRVKMCCFCFIIMGAVVSVSRSVCMGFQKVPLAIWAEPCLAVQFVVVCLRRCRLGFAQLEHLRSKR